MKKSVAAFASRRVCLLVFCLALAAGRTCGMAGAEGAEGKGFPGMFTDIVDTMKATAGQRLEILVTDVTDENQPPA